MFFIWKPFLWTEFLEEDFSQESKSSTTAANSELALMDEQRLIGRDYGMRPDVS